MSAVFSVRTAAVAMSELSIPFKLYVDRYSRRARVYYMYYVDGKAYIKRSIFLEKLSRNRSTSNFAGCTIDIRCHKP